jgi:fatty acid desaturase
VALKKARKIRFQRFGVFASVALWVAILVALAGLAAALFVGPVAVFAGLVPAALCFAVSKHFVVAAERDYYEAELARKRAREINKWLNDQGSASASEP